MQPRGVQIEALGFVGEPRPTGLHLLLRDPQEIVGVRRRSLDAVGAVEQRHALEREREAVDLVLEAQGLDGRGQQIGRECGAELDGLEESSRGPVSDPLVRVDEEVRADGPRQRRVELGDKRVVGDRERDDLQARL